MISDQEILEGLDSLFDCINTGSFIPEHLLSIVYDEDVHVRVVYSSGQSSSRITLYPDEIVLKDLYRPSIKVTDAESDVDPRLGSSILGLYTKGIKAARSFEDFYIKRLLYSSNHLSKIRGRKFQ